MGPIRARQHREALAAHDRQLRGLGRELPGELRGSYGAGRRGDRTPRGATARGDATCYERAIRSARANGFVHHEALAHELAGRFYLQRGFETAGSAHLRHGRACYALWGADGKVRQLDELYPHLRQSEPAPDARGTIGAPIEHLSSQRFSTCRMPCRARLCWRSSSRRCCARPSSTPARNVGCSCCRAVANYRSRRKRASAAVLSLSVCAKRPFPRLSFRSRWSVMPRARQETRDSGRCGGPQSVFRRRVHRQAACPVGTLLAPRETGRACWRAVPREQRRLARVHAIPHRVSSPSWSRRPRSRSRTRTSTPISTKRKRTWRRHNG